MTAMKSAKIAETRVVILETGEEALAALTKFANDAGITGASSTAIRSVSERYRWLVRL